MFRDLERLLISQLRAVLRHRHIYREQGQSQACKLTVRELITELRQVRRLEEAGDPAELYVEAAALAREERGCL
jgi:hypothetical protein